MNASFYLNHCLSPAAILHKTLHWFSAAVTAPQSSVGALGLRLECGRFLGSKKLRSFENTMRMPCYLDVCLRSEDEDNRAAA